MKTICSLTLHDLMAEDVDIWLTRNKKFGFDLEIDDEEGHELIIEKGIPDAAAESFARFCRHFLSCYDRAANQLQDILE